MPKPYRNKEYIDWIEDFLVDTEPAGVELVVNGGFIDASDWAPILNWSIAGGVAHSDGSEAGPVIMLNTDVVVVPGVVYEVTIDILNYVSGDVTVVIGDQDGTTRTANGTYTELIECGAATDIGIKQENNFEGDVDNISIKESTIRFTEPTKMQIRDMSMFISGLAEDAIIFAEFSPDEMETKEVNLDPGSMTWYQRSDGSWTGAPAEQLNIWENLDFSEGWVRFSISAVAVTTDLKIKTRPRIEKAI